MTNDPTWGAPDPEANRAAWFAAHPEAAQVSPAAAQEEVAAQLGAAAPGPGVPDADLGRQMDAAGAAPGLPYEDAMNAMMEQIKALSEQVVTLQQRDRQREAAAIAALGEPILQRYANAVRDAFTGLTAAHPGGAEHFAAPLKTATELAKASADAISRGANDLGQVNYLAAQLDRWFDRGHARTAPGHIRHVDLSTPANSLELLMQEADRLAPGGSNGPGSAVAIAS